MNIKINVYGDCTSEEPTKSYTVRRLLFKTAKELGTLQEETKNASEKEQEKITLKMLQAVIPEFTEEDLQGVDPFELVAFFRTIGAEINGVVAKAEKN
jgi:hypothetical protein